ncbi:Coiled-coil domain-containing protein 103, partial [Stegodyphus mimosarum]
MVSIDSDNIDFSVLIENLDTAIESDRIYSLRNAAKIRAVNQSGTTYEDFENIVKGATLKPIDKNDKLYCNPRHTWNPIAQKMQEETIDKILQNGSLSKKQI